MFPIHVLAQSLTLIAFVTAAPQVKIGNTTLVGRDVPSLKQEFFGGIPFAEPPVGELRFKPPVLKPFLDASSFDASNFGLSCLQPVEETDADKISEDCLTINVFRPAGLPSNASLPVMAWIYGGGFIEGGSAIYNASGIIGHSVARGTPVIYVSLNYRLGPWGFPQGQEAQDRGVLNLGLKDQLAALRWVQENIGSFGGNKKKVTVFGESAGAISIGALFLDPSFGKYARAAIFESGSASTVFLNAASRREADWQAFVAAVPSCASKVNTHDTLDCLRKANSSTLLQAFGVATSKADEQFPWIPTVDGQGGIIPDFPSTLVKNGHFAKLPFIAGTNLDEGTAFTDPSVHSTDQIRLSLTSNFTPSYFGTLALEKAIDEILELYPDDPALGSPFNTGNETFGLSSQFKRASAITGDLAFDSQRRAWIRAASDCGVKTYGYKFIDPQPSLQPFLGVAHGAEVLYVYGGVTNGSSAINLSSRMLDYWISFAASLDPNDGHGSERLAWAQYTPHNQVLLQLHGDNTTLIPDDYRKKQIDFILSAPIVWHHKRALGF